VLGTSLALRFLADRAATVEQAEAVALDVFRESARIFDAYDPSSELSRWNAAPAGTTWNGSAELLAVLDRAFGWWERTGGAFHPGCDEAVGLWRTAEAAGAPPDQCVLRELALRLEEPPWTRVGDTGVARGPATVRLDAIAKGHIVDRAIRAASEVPGVDAVLVNAGGDLRVEGGDGWIVPIADPQSLADNVAGERVRIASGAIATSGIGRRGFRIAGAWHGHLIDPRTAAPVEGAVLASAWAPEAADADALATAAAVGTAEEAMAWADAAPGFAVRRVAVDGTIRTNTRWNALREGVAR